MGESVSLARLLTDIQQRDARDQSRTVSPLVPAEDAIIIDSTALSADEVLQAARDWQLPAIYSATHRSHGWTPPKRQDHQPGWVWKPAGVISLRNAGIAS